MVETGIRDQVIHIERGARHERTITKSSPIRHAFLTYLEATIVDDETLNPPEHPSLVYLISQTIPPSTFEERGIVTYPSSELVERTSKKINLYHHLLKERIPTPPTLRLTHDWLTQAKSVGILEKMRRSLNSVIVKPLDTFTERRAAELPKAYYDFLERREEILDQEAQYETDMVLQPERGHVIKVFGCLPDLFFFEDEAGNVEICPPNIIRTCRRIFEDFEMPFGGIDFVTTNNVLWQVIDVNPTTGGRKLPPEYEAKFEETMHGHIQDLLQGKKVEKNHDGHEIKVVIAAAGDATRMRTVSTLPKSLLPLNQDETILDRALELPQALSTIPGFSPSVEMVVQPKHRGLFDEWAHRWGDDINLHIVNSPMAENKSSYTDVVSTRPITDGDLVLQLAADRIYNNLSHHEIKHLAETVKTALVTEKYPFVIAGVRDDTSKYVYEVDMRTGTILQVCNRNEPIKRMFEDGVTELIGIKKICYAWDMAKATVISARNTTEMSRLMLEAGCLGKMVLMSGVEIMDIDEPRDYEIAKERFHET